jgi:large subunit ribosomal protein L31
VKATIHPKNFETTIVCSTCGTNWPTHSTKQNMRVDICSHCHPFYTGEQRIVDTAGQVDRFMKRLQTSQSQQAEAARRRARLGVPAARHSRPLVDYEVIGRVWKRSNARS